MTVVIGIAEVGEDLDPLVAPVGDVDLAVVVHRDVGGVQLAEAAAELPMVEMYWPSLVNFWMRSLRQSAT